MLGNFFAPTGVIGTVLIIIGLVAMAMKQTDDGVAFFAKKFGKNWQEKNIVKFLDWPLLIVGPLMWFKDVLWIDAAKVLAAYGIFCFVVWWRKRNAENVKKEQEAKTPA